MKVPICVLAIITGSASLLAAAETVINPFGFSWEAEPVRLRAPAPGPAGSFTVLRDGEAVPYQIEREGERNRIWVAVTLPAGAQSGFEIAGSRPASPFPPAVAVRREGDLVELDNGHLAVRVGAGGPLLAVRAGNGPWRGRSATAAPARERLEVDSGPVFAEARVISEYAGGGERLFAVRLLPGRPYAIVTETHRDAPDWIFEVNANWPTARRAVVRRWYRGPFLAAPAEEELELDNAATRIPDAVLYALPRWTQSYDQGWFLGVTDGSTLIAMLPIRAGRWVWPHDNALVLAAARPGAAVFRGPAQRGARQWLLIAGERGLAGAALDLATRAGFAPLDKLHNEYVLTPFRADEPWASPIRPANFYSAQTNPTDVLRRFAREEAKRADQPSRSRQDLYDAQAYLDPDWFGDYANFWSPINPNFYTDFIKFGIVKTARLREHPEFERLRRRAVAALRADLLHAVTLPGGAGQECPGYQHHAAEQWAELAPIAARHLGFDLRTDPRWRATGYFLAHSSVPAGGGRRRFHPAGDTHPDKPDPLAAAQAFGYRSDPRSWRTEELPGFGVIFRNRCGESDETFLSFKAGPNRGHYHGDSLSFHLSFDARDAAPDHRVSYYERPGQEHLHNRMAFRSPRFAYSNMDGFERLITFKTSDMADVAVAQVESPRLREVKPLPPEEWDQAHPQQPLASPLVYRRTIVFLRRGGGLARDAVVIRDQFWYDPHDEIEGVFCLHVRGDGPRVEGRTYRFGVLTLIDATPSPGRFEAFAWTPRRENLRGEATRGVRLLAPAREGYGELVTVIWPGDAPPPTSPLPGGVSVGPLEVRFAGSEPNGAASVTIQTEGGTVLALADEDTNLDRSQGDVGLFVPTVGYPFGPVPAWLIRQRAPISLGAASDASREEQK